MVSRTLPTKSMEHIGLFHPKEHHAFSPYQIMGRRIRRTQTDPPQREPNPKSARARHGSVFFLTRPELLARGPADDPTLY